MFPYCESSSNLLKRDHGSEVNLHFQWIWGHGDSGKCLKSNISVAPRLEMRIQSKVWYTYPLAIFKIIVRLTMLLVSLTCTKAKLSKVIFNRYKYCHGMDLASVSGPLLVMFEAPLWSSWGWLLHKKLMPLPLQQLWLGMYVLRCLINFLSFTF